MYHFLNGVDFYEGVRALLIAKDRNPKWNPSRIEDVSTESALAYFRPLPNGDELPMYVWQHDLITIWFLQIILCFVYIFLVMKNLDLKTYPNCCLATLKNLMLITQIFSIKKQNEARVEYLYYFEQTLFSINTCFQGTPFIFVMIFSI